MEPKKELAITILRTLEKYGFLIMVLSYRSLIRLTDLNLLAHKVAKKKMSLDQLVTQLQKRILELKNVDSDKDEINSRFRVEGFYNWIGIKYFLFEYELSLKGTSKTKRMKINWREFKDEQEDFITVEHIYPQTADKDCWKENFDSFSKREKRNLLNSLGNLLPLSKPKNSSLQNRCFTDKIDNKVNQVGFKYGSYSENEISGLTEWTPEKILERGLKLINFMEQRWELNFGDEDKKVEILGLKFLQNSNQQKKLF